MKTLEQRFSEQAARKINNNPLTHQQTLTEVTDSWTVDKKYQHLLPIINSATQEIINAANEYRLTKAARRCLTDVCSALEDVYQCGVPMSFDADGIFTGTLATSTGQIIDRGTWYYAGDADAYQDQQSEAYDAGALNTSELDAVKASVRAANQSEVFKTAGVELVILDGPLIYGGMIS